MIIPLILKYKQLKHEVNKYRCWYLLYDRYCQTYLDALKKAYQKGIISVEQFSEILKLRAIEVGNVDLNEIIDKTLEEN